MLSELIWNKPRNFENIRADLKMKIFFRDHTNPMRKGETFSEDLFPLKLFCSYTAMYQTIPIADIFWLLGKKNI